MFVEKYFYAHGNTIIGKGVYDIALDRDIGMTRAFNNVYGDKLFNITTDGPTAFLYAGGPMVHNSDSTDNKYNTKCTNVIIKQQVGDKVYRLANKIPNVEFVSINSDACASAMKLIYDAKSLLANGYITDVVIYAENLVVPIQLKFFEQLGVDILCGDGVGIVHLTNTRTTNTVAEIPYVAWHWNYDATSLTVSSEGYRSILNKLIYNKADITIIKPHGTGTIKNNAEEDSVIKEYFGDIPTVKYKQTIGHTQGASALIEMCMLLDEVDTCNAIIMASGLGAVYGACTLIK